MFISLFLVMIKYMVIIVKLDDYFFIYGVVIIWFFEIFGILFDMLIRVFIL